ncbi:phosphoribosylglycinamide formyltransferase [Pseudarthrobacter albicanus]|uniref:phosphoribosylglycinamide formyltransferase n=1 Tax=Pseudarthrobacter albicanus TaxID=2823873 RepID=UPI001BA83DFA|nr:phosphoribosylglycinamide formyltransferase [Pseudarthrobacter albicanus]
MRIVVLVSGTGSNLQAVIDAVKDGRLDLEIAAVGADRPGTYGIERSAAAGIPTFVVDFKAYPDRAAWNAALTGAVAAFAPDLVVSSGFMRIVSADFIEAFGGKYLNTHPALLPAFPGAHGVRDALAYGVKVTGCTVHWADAGVDTGPIIAQEAVAVGDGETEESLHERIKVVERRLLVSTLASLAPAQKPEYPAHPTNSQHGPF